jgi:tetratricopeptide (TPR) repeat protein
MLLKHDRAAYLQAMAPLSVMSEAATSTLPSAPLQETLLSKAASASQQTQYSETYKRDALLQHAYRLFELSPSFVPGGITYMPLSSTITALASDPELELLPLLNMLNTTHVRHCPTLLLLGCVHFALRNFQLALEVFQEILNIDPYFVCPVFP